SPKIGEKGRGLIKAFRFGLVMHGASRMVLDLARPARIDKAFVLEAGNDQPARLVLDLAAVDHETFMRTIALENRPPETVPPRRPGGAVRLDPRRRICARGAKRPRGGDLHALRDPLGRRRGPPGRGREPGGRDRRPRSLRGTR